MTSDPAPGDAPGDQGSIRIEAVGDDVERAPVVLSGFYAGTDWTVTPSDAPFSFRYAALGDAAMTLRTSQMQGTNSGDIPVGDDYIVQWLVAGSSTIDLHRDAIPQRRGVPLLFPAHRSFEFTFTDYDQKLVHLGRDHVDRTARERGLRGPLRFDHLRPVDPAAAGRWHAAISEISNAVRTGRVTPLLWDRLSRRGAAAFLELYPPEAAVLPEVLLTPPNAGVRSAVEFLHENAHLALGPIEIAAAAHLSVRGLQVAFQRVLGTTPLQYLRDLRLDRARTDLRLADPERTTVADIAREWGFGHLGRFSAAYAARFGEYPSQTLQY
ncbi:AraC-like DNA-binding protein [Rathayibacter sp. PhB151]|uniref:AraC family transcriptional regulator n=1 Tax=Rathayibacter sp. PhB151 TaxID=2485189 RepID=UPI001063AA30|nr:AraC family transcriptional regulator [Rathayibacter sp. PhB151]TDX79050.1 AraC-like DNA-binding protein [Rathayibacter sp. PhB151]